jgi:peptidoglycan/LPS O-acetylase OafA/YrhL
MSITAPATTSDSPRHIERHLIGNPTFVSIQILRGLAAVSVVVFHSFTALPGDMASQAWLFDRLKPFEIGVDIFFIVSGFVMAASTDGQRAPSAKALLLRRAARIFPLYWLACLIYLPSAALSVGLGSLTSDPVSLLASILLLPQDTRLIAQSWTLTHEWEFYGVIALALALGARRHLAHVLMVLTAIGWLQEVAGTRLVSDTIVSGHMVEFLAGWLLYGARHRVWRRLPPAGAVVCLIVGSSIVLAEAVAHWTIRGLFWRLLMSGGPALAIVTATLALEAELRARQATVIVRFAQRIGDTSYSIYLFHLCVLGGLGTVLALGGPYSAGAVWATTAAAVIAATGFGVAVGVLIELPMQARIKAWQSRDRRRPALSPAE